MDIITTKSVGLGIEQVEEDFILSEEPMSRLVFKAQIHTGGIRGKIVRQRRESSADTWNSEKAIDIRTLGKNESINLEISTDAVKNLYQAIYKLAKILNQQGVEYGENKYAIVDPNTVVITDENISVYVKKIVAAGHDEEVWKDLAESNPSLVTKLSYATIQSKKQEVVDELAVRLRTGGYSETSGDSSWQAWIYKHNWLFGVNYQEAIPKVKINVTGVMPDYLFPTLDEYIDILEIKLPTDDVIVENPSHAGAWKWTTESNMAIGQVINYLGEIDRMRREIEANIFASYGKRLSFIKPRAYILIGNSSGWSQIKKDGLRKMNHALHGIEIVTYKDLLDRGNQTIQLLLENI